MGLNELSFFSNNALNKLRNYGLYTRLDIAISNPEDIIAYGLNKDEAILLIENARKNFHYLKKGVDIIGTRKLRHRISTGSSSLDLIIDNGISTGRVTELYGGSSTGKSQICFQLCVNALLNQSYADKVVFLDTAGAFRPERIKEMIDEQKIIQPMLNRILLMKVRNSVKQINIIRAIQYSKFLGNIKLLVIDNLTDNFLFDYPGNENIGKRQHNLARHINDLADLALNKNIAVVVTNTARDKFKDQENVLIEGTGGKTVSENMHIIIRLEKCLEGWIGYRVNTNRTGRFKIAKQGIMDWEN